MKKGDFWFCVLFELQKRPVLKSRTMAKSEVSMKFAYTIVLF